MNRATSALIIIEILGLGLAGCRESAPPPRVPIPSQADRYGSGRDADEMRPLPPPSYPDSTIQPPYDDVPLINQRPPEQGAFVEAYQRVASPRITLFVAGEENDPTAASIDYDAVETIMTDWLAANGQVTVIAPTVARRRLNDAQVRSSLAQQLGADVVVYVRAAATPSSSQGKDLRLVAQAINVQGGESIGRAVVDVPPPLEKGQINDYTRFLARKLMDDMTQTWSAAPRPPQRPVPPARPAPGAPPATGPSARSGDFPN